MMRDTDTAVLIISTTIIAYYSDAFDITVIS